MSALTAYAAERLPLSLLAPAVLLLASGSWWASTAPLDVFPAAIALAGLLFVQLRLWDDLEDGGRDRLAHPERVLVNRDPRSFWWLLVALTTMNVAILATTWTAVSVFVVMLAGLALAYRGARRFLSDPQWRYGILLLKYPAIVVVVSAAIGKPGSTRLVLCVIAAYGTAAAYEWWHHDRRLPIGVAS